MRRERGGAGDIGEGLRDKGFVQLEHVEVATVRRESVQIRRRVSDISQHTTEVIQVINYLLIAEGLEAGNDATNDGENNDRDRSGGERNGSQRAYSSATDHEECRGLGQTTENRFGGCKYLSPHSK